MGGILLLCGFELCGVTIALRLAVRRGAAVRLWLGLCLGLVLMMWLPAIFAFFMDFTLPCQLCGLLTAAVCAALVWVFRRNSVPGEIVREKREVPLWLLAALVLPLLLIGVYLQCTHTIREVDGALHVGQSTYGDLCLHLGIATGLRNASFPPTYTLLQGVELGYPFLSDSLAASMLLAGSSLRTAFVFSGSLMLLLVFSGFVIFAWEMTESPMAVAVSYVLLFLNGGLGFLYVFDGAAGDSSMLRSLFTGYYQAPANMPEYNLRWVNVICDMLIPQRTLLAGWMTLFPALFLLTNALREKRRELFVELGLWAGAMPMIHTHTFLALGLISAGAMASALIREERGKRFETALRFLLYSGIAVLLAAPQLLRWTFPQTAGGGSLGVRLNWVNNTGNNRFIDGYFWFWIKNVGIVYLLLVPAALCADGTGRALALGALLVYVTAEIFQFQPNPYDNNKLFYVAFIAVLPPVGAFVKKIWDRLKGLKCRAYFLALFLLVSTLSGGLSLAREMISDYRIFTADEAAAAEFIDANTEEDAVFLTGCQHNNPVAALAGRQIVCGTGSYLYYHGIDYSRQQTDVRTMMENPAEFGDLLEQYGVDYVYVSSYERGDFAVDEAYFAEECELVYESGDVRLYRLPNSR